MYHNSHFWVENNSQNSQLWPEFFPRAIFTCFLQWALHKFAITKATFKCWFSRFFWIQTRFRFFFWFFCSFYVDKKAKRTFWCFGLKAISWFTEFSRSKLNFDFSALTELFPIWLGINFLINIFFQIQTRFWYRFFWWFQTCSCPFRTIFWDVNLGWNFFSVFKLSLWNLFWGKFKTYIIIIQDLEKVAWFIKKIPQQFVLFLTRQKEKK